MGGEWLGRPVTFTGLGFFTSTIGAVIILLLASILLITGIPLAGSSEVIQRKYRDIVRLALSLQVVILSLATWAVMTEFTLEFSRLEVRFGLYGTLLGSLAAALYSFLLLQSARNHQYMIDEHAHLAHAQNLPMDLPHTDAPPPPSQEPEEFKLHH